MQNELETEYPELDIQLVGVNAFGHESGVEVAAEGRHIPMLQDVDDDGNSLGDTWDLWAVEWRDVVILDAQNQPVAVYNLTDHDLADPYSYNALKDLLLETADVDANESSISGYVYFDTNDDGIRDSAELAISQVEIVLSGTDDQGQSVNMTTRSGTDGHYSFAALPQGDYVVTQKQPSMTVDGRDTIGSQGGTVTNDRFEISLGDAVDAEGYNFGERGRSATTISLTDFFSSASRNSMLFVSEPDGHLEWFCLEGEWRDITRAEVSTDSSEVTIVLEAELNNVWGGTFDRDDMTHVRQLARVNSREMDRVSADWSPQQAFLSDQPESEAEGEALRDMALASMRISPADDIYDAPLDADEVDALFAENELFPKS